MKDKELVGDLEVHVKYMGEWLTMGKKESVKDRNLGQAINLVATEIQKSVENAFFLGDIDQFAAGKINKDGTLSPA